MITGIFIQIPTFTGLKLMSQPSLWQEQQLSADYAELCNALYERELRTLSLVQVKSVEAIQGRLKSLPYYVKRTAHLMTQAQSPLMLDAQNASWSAKQGASMPLTGQDPKAVWQWYQSFNIVPGLVVPVLIDNRIMIDCVDRIDSENNRFHTNANGWFTEERVSLAKNSKSIRLLKPNKKVLSAACAGHRWGQKGALRPQIPSMRELLLSCAINWRNFKRPVAF